MLTKELVYHSRKDDKEPTEMSQFPKFWKSVPPGLNKTPPMIFMWDNVCRLVKKKGGRVLVVALWVKAERLLRYPQMLKDNILITNKLQK